MKTLKSFLFIAIFGLQSGYTCAQAPTTAKDYPAYQFSLTSNEKKSYIVDIEGLAFLHFKITPLMVGEGFSLQQVLRDAGCSKVKSDHASGFGELGLKFRISKKIFLGAKLSYMKGGANGEFYTKKYFHLDETTKLFITIFIPEAFLPKDGYYTSTYKFFIDYSNYSIAPYIYLGNLLRIGPSINFHTITTSNDRNNQKEITKSNAQIGFVAGFSVPLKNGFGFEMDYSYGGKAKMGYFNIGSVESRALSIQSHNFNIGIFYQVPISHK